MKFSKKKVLGVLAVVLAIVAISVGSSTAAGLITGSQIAKETVTGTNLKDGTVNYKDLSKGTRELIMEQCTANTKSAGFRCDQIKRVEVSNDGKTLTLVQVDGTRKDVTIPEAIDGDDGNDGKSAYEIAVDNGFTGTEAEWLESLKGADGTNGANGTNGTNGTDGADGVVDPVFSVGDETTVADMGGSWGTFAAPRATLIDTVSLEAGEYLLNAEGIMTTLGADADGFFGQIAVRSVDNTTWGKDLGTCFTADFGTQANREASCSTTRVVEFAEQTEVKVFAFGYQRDGQGGVSNAVKAKSFLTATPVTD